MLVIPLHCLQSKVSVWLVLLPHLLDDSRWESQLSPSSGRLEKLYNCVVRCARRWKIQNGLETRYVLPLIERECERTHDKMMMSHSEPWKPSTVATLTLSLELFNAGILRNCSLRSFTCSSTKQERNGKCFISNLQKVTKIMGKTKHKTTRGDSPDLCRRK